jgi:ferric-dicitrate binding protein FerR (iron transport regulator)
MTGRSLPGIIACLGLLLVCGAAFAQPAGCMSDQAGDPPRTVIRCADGLTITAEAAARLRLKVGRGGGVRGIILDDKAVFVDTGGRRPRGFQVQAPYAIASVRGTRFAVDAAPDDSAVFVQRGTVDVTRRSSGAKVTLRDGDGVHVRPGERVLTVNQWAPAARASLLGRLGER